MGKDRVLPNARKYLEELEMCGYIPKASGEDGLRRELLEIRLKFAADRRYKETKLVNHVLMEMDLAQKNEKVSYLPPKLLIEHTNLCNARCIMCSHCYTDNYGRGYIEKETMEKIRRLLPFADKVFLHGIGEPFLHPHITDYIRMYRSYGVEVSCNTNLSVMNEEIRDCIRDCFRTITISCDSPVKETFENIRRNLSFDTFCRNVRILREAAPKLEIRMNVVAMRQNLAELPDLIPFARELGVNALSVMDLTAQKYMENEEDEIWRYPAAAKYYIRQMIERAEKSGVRLLCYPEHVLRNSEESTLEEDIARIVSIPFYPDDEKIERLAGKYRRIKAVKPLVQASQDNVGCISTNICEGICDNFADTPFFSADGEVFCCCIDGVHTFGNLGERDFEEIWNGSVYRLMRRNFYSGHLPKYCKACSFLKGNVMSRLRLLKVDRSFYENEFSVLLNQIGRGAEEK